MGLGPMSAAERAAAREAAERVRVAQAAARRVELEAQKQREKDAVAAHRRGHAVSSEGVDDATAAAMLAMQVAAAANRGEEALARELRQQRERQRGAADRRGEVRLLGEAGEAGGAAPSKARAARGVAATPLAAPARAAAAAQA